jgi:single-stranded-DNA-specific exonuclease
MAAGFTISRENIIILQEKISQVSELEIDESLLIPVIDIDLKIPLDLVSLSFLEEMNKLKPFGIGNNEPLFLSEKAGISSLNIVGKESNHLSMRLFGGSNFYKAIFFNGSEYAKGLNVGDKVDIVFSIKE